MKALILAAGYATRLYPLTKEYPKPLLVVENRPIINYIIDKLNKIDGIDEIIIVTNDKFISYFKKWAKGIDIAKTITLANDLTKNHSDKLGAIGDMDFVIDKEKINDDLLVVGGDNLFDSELDNFLRFVKRVGQSPVIGVYDIKDKTAAKKYGIVETDPRKVIVNFEEKPENPRSTLAAMCVYYFPKSTLGFIKDYLWSKHDKRDATGFYIDWLRRKTTVYAFRFGGRWYDIGDHHFYDQAKKKFAKH